MLNPLALVTARMEEAYELQTFPVHSFPRHSSPSIYRTNPGFGPAEARGCVLSLLPPPLVKTNNPIPSISNHTLRPPGHARQDTE